MGTQVRLIDGARRDGKGSVGTIERTYGHPDYLALDVRFEDGGAELCWHTSWRSSMVLEGYDRQAAGAGRGRKGCPPHGPHLIDVLEEGTFYAAQCLRCGLSGPVSKDGPGAKLAFDQRWP